MAEGLLRHDGGAAFEVRSAGIRPTEVRAEAIEIMAEIGVDISQQRSKNVGAFDGERFDYVITVCDHARERPVRCGRERGRCIGAFPIQRRQAETASSD